MYRVRTERTVSVLTVSIFVTDCGFVWVGKGRRIDDRFTLFVTLL